MKILFYKLVTTLILLSVSSCDGQNKAKNINAESGDIIYQISLEDALKNQGKLNLSEIADEVEYIELKKIIGVRSIGVSNEFIFIDNKGELHKFDKQGNYICPIGRRGRGPNEYLSVVDMVSFNEEQQRIYVPNYSNIMVYSFEGVLVERIEMPMASGCVMVRGGIVYQGFDTFDGYHSNKLLAIDSKNDTLFYIPNYHKIEAAQQTFAHNISEKSAPFYQYRGEVYYRGYYCEDTIYQIMRDSYNVHAMIDMGKFKRPHPTNPFDSFVEMAQGKGDYYLIAVFLEDDNRFYIKCSTYGSIDMKDKFFVFDKKSLAGYSVENEDGSIGINDDINGGAPFIPTIITDDCYISVKSALDFIEQNKKRAGSSEKLRKFLNTINDESNHIVTFVHKK